MHTLQGWKKESPTSSRAIIARVGLATLLVCMGLTYYLCLRLPYQRPKLHVVVLTPFVEKNANDQFNGRSDSIPRTVRLEPECDLAACLCNASGRLVEQVVQQCLPPGHIELSGRQLTERAKCLKNVLGQAEYQPSTLVVYLSGVLSLENKQPALCDHSHTALHGGEELLILPMIDALQHATDQQVLICIDLVAPYPTSPANIVAPLIAEELTELIEQRLSKQSGSSPLAVCIQLSSVDPLAVHDLPSTVLASAMSQALQAELESGTFQASRFKERLTLHSYHQSYGRAQAAELLWLTNLQWPAVTPPITLPRRVPPQHAHEPAHEPTGQLSNMPLSPTPAPGFHLQSDIESLTPPQLLSLSRQAVRQFDVLPDANDLVIAPDWLPIPQRLSFRQRHPELVARLEHCLKQWETVERLAPNHLNRSGLHALARELSAWAVLPSASRELPSDELSPRKLAPKGASDELRFQATESALVNLLLAQLGAIESRALADASQLVQQLSAAIDHGDSAAQCLGAIVDLQSRWPKLGLELDSCRKLCDANLPWPTLQRALRLQLVALRARVGLFQDSPEVQSQLRLAERLYQRVQAEIDLSPDNHSEAELAILLDRCLGHFHAAIQKMDEVTAENIRHHALVNEFLYRPAWADVSATSRNTTKDALLAFKQSWQLIHPDPLRSIPSGVQTVHSERTAEITRLLDEAEQLLAQPTATTDKKSAALRRLAHAVMTVMEGNPQSISVDDFDRSPIVPAWYHPHWRQLIEANLRASNELLQDATKDQQTQQARLAAIWKRLAAESNQQGLAIEHESFAASMLSVDAPGMIQLYPAKSTPLSCAITYSALAPHTPQLTASYDEDCVAIKLGEQALRPGRAIELTRTNVTGASIAQPDHKESQVVLSVQALNGRPARGPIVLLVSHGHMQRRAVIHLQPPASPMVDVHLINESLGQSTGQGSGAQSDCLLMPNRQQSLRLQLTHRAQAKLQLSAQVWGDTGPLAAVAAQLPSGTIDQTVATQWLMNQPSLMLLAQTAQVELDVSAKETLTLLPAGTPPDLKQSPCGCSGLLIGVTDHHTKRTQFAYRPLHLRCPTDYVQQQMTVDPAHDRLELFNQLRTDTQPISATVKHCLLEWPLGMKVAQATLQLTSVSPSDSVLLSSGRSRAARLVLLTEIDGWPGISAALIDRQQGSIIDQPVGHIELNTGLVDGTLPVGSDKVSVVANAWSSLPPISGQVDLHIGWDRNLDRTLSGETTEHSHRLEMAQAFYRGLDERGALIVESRIEPLRYSFSTAGLSNQRASLLATLSCDGTLLARASQTVVIDQQPPVVKGALVENGNQAVHGTPLAVQINADDHGLSGIARVEVAWSLDGRLRLTDDMQPQPGILRPDGSWRVTIPTATLPLGENMLLVRALDRSGNVSDTYSFTVMLHSQAELDEIAALRTCTVYGSLLFVKQPQSGLLVELVKSLPKEKSANLPGDSQAEQLPTDAQQVVASTISLADGSFRLIEVPSGQYLLRVSGVVRGMRVTQTRVLTIDASRPHSAIEWRLDKQP